MGSAMSHVPLNILSQRMGGVLLHLTSLPGPHGSGDMGVNAYHFVDWLASAGQRLWQILPLSPVGSGNSPYHSASSFAGNPLLVDLDELVQCGWLLAQPQPDFATEYCDFDRVAPYRMARLQAAWQGFLQVASASEQAEFVLFCTLQAHWLEDYALFMALESEYGKSWTQWPEPLRSRDGPALAHFGRDMADALGFFRFVQWRFHLQWQRLLAYAHSRGISIIGDAPIFVAHHSADVWAGAALYQLDEADQPTVVAGVPPDYFSSTGQRWGNPLYRWEVMQSTGFAWWKARLGHLLGMVDVVRLDHFRGFESYWEIPSHEPTAIAGCWKKGPGKVLFDALAADGSGARGRVPLPIIAEDLGLITEEVTALRRACGFPGMRVLQFAFGDTPDNPYLPHNYDALTVAYTGTHDNDTSVGWWQKASASERRAARNYLGPQADTEIHWAMMRALSQSLANTVIFPFQDVLGLDSAHRMNTPGLAQGCWQWRFDWGQVQSEPAQRLADMTGAHGRNVFSAHSGAPSA
jgi:4-alpha-glucanotransferase